MRYFDSDCVSLKYALYLNEDVYICVVYISGDVAEGHHDVRQMAKVGLTRGKTVFSLFIAGVLNLIFTMFIPSPAKSHLFDTMA